MKKRVALAVALLVAYLLLVVPLVTIITAPDHITLTNAEYARLADRNAPVGNRTDGTKYLTLKLFGMIPVKQVLVDILPVDSVAVGGLPVGICGEIDGVLVTHADRVLRAGDVISAVDGVPVHNWAEWLQARGDGTVRVTFRRGKRELQQTLPADVAVTGRDTTTGVGILTFINPENQHFAALGHQMGDWETGAGVNLSGGSVRAVSVQGIQPSANGHPGILESAIKQGTPAQGSITSGTEYGITGCLVAGSDFAQQAVTLPVATRYQVKPGAATLRTSLDGVTVEEFACEIIKPRFQRHHGDKSMVIRVTDKRLLAQTGGIVHGMSGSPIIQDGHLVGVLTHAIARDPAKGYALYVDFINFE